MLFGGKTSFLRNRLGFSVRFLARFCGLLCEYFSFCNAGKLKSMLKFPEIQIDDLPAFFSKIAQIGFDISSVSSFENTAARHIL